MQPNINDVSMLHSAYDLPIVSMKTTHYGKSLQGNQTSAMAFHGVPCLRKQIQTSHGRALKTMLPNKDRNYMSQTILGSSAPS